MSALPPPPPGGPNPYGQQPPSQQPYGYPPYGGGRPAEHPQGTTILVLGILSIVVCGVLGPFAWSMGSKALREIDADPQAYSNRSNVSAGRICGIVGTVLMALGLAAFVLFIVAAASFGSTQ